MASVAFQPPRAASVLANPSSEELQQLAARMPSAQWTRYGNVNVQTKVLARSTPSTFIVTDHPDPGVTNSVSREHAAEWVHIQDAYIAEQEMILLDGWLGAQPEFRIPVRLYIEAANANIAGMQQQLWFPVDDLEGFEPELTVVYTPNLVAHGWPEDRLILVDLEQGVNRVFNSDYFGESKKGILRMWNKLVYDRGGIPLHAGAKVIPTAAGERVAMIVGLSGTGKTTTTFTRQNGSLPIQDDFVAWMPDGSVYATENGCFAKTFALNPEDEPTIHGAVTQPRSYLENVSQTGDEVDFYDESYTKNGRATFPFEVIESAATRPIEEAHFLLILNRNEGVIPAVAKLEGPQAAAFFMLGETTGTAAGGAAEEGKFLRVPGHEPVLPAAARPPGEPVPGAPRRAPARGLPHEHGERRRPGRRRALAQGADPALVGDRQGHRRGDDRVAGGSRLRLQGCATRARDRRGGRDGPPAAGAVRGAGSRRRVRRPGRAAPPRAAGVPERLREPHARDR